MGAGAVAQEGEKVPPKVDFFSPALADDGINVGLRDEVLQLSLAFQMERMLSFSSIRSASIALKSSSESRHKASQNTPCTTSHRTSTVRALFLMKLQTVGLPGQRAQVTMSCKIL